MAKVRLPLHELFQSLAQQLQPDELSIDPAVVGAHGGDKWFAHHPPDIVALPTSAAAVSRILAFASHHGIPVTTRGAGHGYVGGCVPVHGGIVLSVAHMNRIC